MSSAFYDFSNFFVSIFIISLLISCTSQDCFNSSFKFPPNHNANNNNSNNPSNTNRINSSPLVVSIDECEGEDAWREREREREREVRETNNELK